MTCRPWKQPRNRPPPDYLLTNENLEEQQSHLHHFTGLDRSMSELHQKREALRRSMRAKGQSTFDIRRVWIAHGPKGPVYGWQLRRWVGRFFPSSESSQHGSWEKALKAANDIARDEYIGNLEEWGVKPGDA